MRGSQSFFKASVELGFEGMVAKRKNSIYEPGARSKSWLKVKRVSVQDLLVGVLGDLVNPRHLGSVAL